ncbi:4Fe-4S dicluster domain-containing protein [Chloroflexota bacterium]
MADCELVINYDKCTGCRICETACSVRHGFGANPEKAMIHIVKMEGEADVVSIPVKCMRCEDAPCVAVCPVSAISTHPETGAREIDAKKCIGCSACVYVCPFGAALLDRSLGNSLICDLCEGDPLCAKLCPFGAVQYIRADEVGAKLKRARANKLIDFLKLPSAPTV